MAAKDKGSKKSKGSRAVAVPKDGLTEMQRRFVACYVVHLDATRAATEAGYSQRTAAQLGYQLLHHPSVAAAIRERLRRLAARLDISAERVLQEYARIGFFDPRSVMSWGPDGIRLLPSDELSADAVAAIAEVSETFVKQTVDREGDVTVTRDTLKLTVKFHSKQSALDAMAKHLQLFKDGDTNVTNITVHVASARERLESRIAGLAARIGEEGVLGEPDG